MQVYFTYSTEYNEVTAIFIDNFADNEKTELTCYSHIGQHSVCTPDYCIANSDETPATIEQYTPLLKELADHLYTDIIPITITNYVNYVK